MTCPKCDLPKIVGAAKCACGYRFHEDDSGRPRLNEMTELPRARRSNGGLAMLFGLVLAGGGGWFAYQAYGDRAPNTDMRYLIGGCSGCAGLLCLRRGYDRSTD